MTPQLRDSLISTSDEAFTSLAQQIGHILDHMDFFLNRYQVTANEEHDSLALKHEDLKVMWETLATLPTQLANVIIRWKKGEERLLSRMGVELDILNEIWITMKVVSEFLERHYIELHPYNSEKAERAFRDLVRVNNCIS